MQINVDKRTWKSSPLPGHIVLVSTVNRYKIPNVAPKSWVSMVAFQPAIMGFGCNLKHQTAKNILETKEFVINVPSEDLAENVWKAGKHQHEGAENLRNLGFTLIPSIQISPPRIQECKAHFECIYDSDNRYGDEIWIFGKVVSASIDKAVLEGSKQKRYKHLNPIFYLEDATYGVLGSIKTIKEK